MAVINFIGGGGSKPPPYNIVFSLFSKVEEESSVRRTRWKPYSVVRMKDFGRPSQEITSPFSSAFFRKSLVLWEVDVLSISKIPIMEVSLTAISLPIDKYIPHPQLSLRTSAHTGVAIYSNKLWYRSFHSRFLLSTSLFFRFLFQPLICFSLSIVTVTSLVYSK